MPMLPAENVETDWLVVGRPTVGIKTSAMDFVDPSLKVSLVDDVALLNTPSFPNTSEVGTNVVPRSLSKTLTERTLASVEAGKNKQTRTAIMPPRRAVLPFLGAPRVTQHLSSAKTGTMLSHRTVHRRRNSLHSERFLDMLHYPLPFGNTRMRTCAELSSIALHMEITTTDTFAHEKLDITMDAPASCQRPTTTALHTPICAHVQIDPRQVGQSRT